MKKTYLAAVVVAVVVAGSTVTALAATQPLFTSFAAAATSTPVAVSPSTSLYVEHDAPQQNTCYVVVTKNTATGVAIDSAISCVADHVANDFPPTTTKQQ